MEKLPPPPPINKHPILKRQNAYDGYDSKHKILDIICDKSIIIVLINCLFLWCLYLITFNLILSIILITYINLYYIYFIHSVVEADRFVIKVTNAFTK